MHFFHFLILAASTASVASARVVVNHRSIHKRTVGQGWSLQGSCSSDTTTCAGGGCCPSGLACFAHANSEVAACCSGTSGCRGAIEGKPVCADSNWSLWKGLSGNGFCCEADQIGVYNSRDTVAGTCVASSSTSGYTSAVLISSGTGSSVAAATSSTSTTLTIHTTSTMTSAPNTITSTTIAPTTNSPSTLLTSAATSVSTSVGSTSTAGNVAASSGKPVFFHYMVGGVTDAHIEQDIKDAMALGVDAFALNTNTVTASYAKDCITSMFTWANTLGFKLFFSFDMTGFTDPDQFTANLTTYVTNAAYYHYNDLPLVSTFNGGASSYTFGQSTVNEGWKVQLQDVMSTAGHPIYFVPAFQDVTITSSFFTTFPTLDGAFNWNSWATNTAGDIVVPTTDDKTLQTAATDLGKTFLMGVSPLQFKHLDSGDNWYRRGEQNLEYRFGQVLSMQPDFIELQTWNDGGESHYMGNNWPEPIAETVIPGYTDGYDHTGYWQILPAFINAYKSGATTTATMYPTNGATAQGTFWHHTLLAAGTCPTDTLGAPTGVDTVEDRVTAVILVASGQTGLSAVVTSGTTTLGTQTLVAGYNGFSFLGMTTGTVSVKVVDSAGTTVVSGTGPIDVVSTATLCNYNFQVVGLA